MIEGRGEKPRNKKPRNNTTMKMKTKLNSLVKVARIATGIAACAAV